MESVMKTNRSVAVLSLMVGLAGFAAAAQAAPACEPAKLAEKYPSLAGKTIKVGADPQTPPYAMRDATDFNKMSGVDVELAAAVLDCAGIKHEMFLGGWSGLMPATAGGQVDIFWDNLYYTAERAKQLDYVLYMQAATGALTQAGNPKKITSMDTSCGTTYAVGLGTVEEVAARKQDAACTASGKPGITVMTYPDMASGLRLLQSGRADIMMTDLALVDSLVAETPKSYERAYKIMSGFTIGAAVKKGSPDLLKAIDDGLQAVQADGRQKAIFAKYKVDADMIVPAAIKTQ
jgi:polar amino acid transport system substrate-binding protein